jgi:hypothetical protein
MGCRPLPGGGFACGRGRRTAPPCVGCGRPSVARCDFKLSGKAEGRTCDRPLCATCRVRQSGGDIDYCPAHARTAVKEGEGA